MLRRAGRGQEATELVAGTRALDPLDWWSAHLEGGAAAARCNTQTALDLSLDYADAGRLGGWQRCGRHDKLAGWLLACKSSLGRSASACRGALYAARVTWAPQLAPHAPTHYLSPPPPAPVAGLYQVALELLGPHTEAPSPGTAPLLHYYRAYFHHQMGQAQEEAECLGAAAAAPPDYCFPARLQEFAILQHAVEQAP